jgi:hypothetical protein
VVAAVHEAVSRQLFEDAVNGFSPELCMARGWILRLAEYPLLEIDFTADARQAVRIRLKCDGWNSTPPSVEWFDTAGNVLPSLPQGPGGQLNNGAHPQTGRPFVCMAGVREYHTHPSHTGDLWDGYKNRPGYDLGGIVTQIWRAWSEAKP